MKEELGQDGVTRALIERCKNILEKEEEDEEEWDDEEEEKRKKKERTECTIIKKQ